MNVKHVTDLFEEGYRNIDFVFNSSGNDVD